MKKFILCTLSFVALSLIMASCGGDEPASISLDVTFKSVPLTGETFTVNVTSASAWTAAPSQSWVTVSPKEGQGDAAVTITVAAGEEGVANVLFTDGDKVAILKIERTASPTSISCDPASKTVSGAGESFAVALKSTGDWTATPDQSWVTVSPKEGQGNASVTVTVAAGGDGNAKVVFKCGESTATLKIERVSSPTYADGALPGKFSIKKRREYVDGEWQYDWIQIQFSQGNLQYNKSTQIWKFADNQLEILSSNEDWMDMFCWGTGDRPTATIPDTTQIPDAYGSYDIIFHFHDWGDNPISNGGYTPNTWFTLCQEQWADLLHERANAENLFGMGTVNGKEGIILLPDDWTTTPTDVPAFKPGVQNGLEWGSYVEQELGWPVFHVGYFNKNKYINNFLDNTYTEDQWSAMQSAGAVFLPFEYSYCYWTSDYFETLEGELVALAVRKSMDWSYNVSTYCETFDRQMRNDKCAVRLVKEVK